MKLFVLVGPPGVGKDTLVKDMIFNDGDHGSATAHISQDLQGKEHLNIFHQAIKDKKDIIINRMNFDKKQRARYLNPAKEAGYETEIIVLHENLETCLKRCNERTDHPNIRDETTARKVLDFFFSKYERPTLDEANKVDYRYPKQTINLTAIYIDIDSTLSNTDHRQHLVRGPEKKNWREFFNLMHLDPVNDFCRKIINGMRQNYTIILCSGRPDNYEKVTRKWLEDNKIFYDHLFMRSRSDSRQDFIVKENLLDFEIKTRVNNILFCIDDRKQVIDMLRNRGLVVLDCAGDKGNF